MSYLILSFKKINKNDATIAGGKGASLGEMIQAGIPVPPGFVILSDAFERFLEETDLNVEIDSILHSVDHKEIHTVEDASEKIKTLILQAEMPQDIALEIKANFKKLGAKFVAVRSSATAEDSSTAAWAGQLDSFLNTTEEILLPNVKKCWASLFTPRAIFYRFEKGLHGTHISVAVVVQKMVNSEKAGIAFSVHPVTEDYNQIIIEAGFGLGEAIVSGQITPDSYVIEKEPRRIIDVNVAEQESGLFRKDNGGNEWKKLGDGGKEQVISEKEILELSELILKIEKHYGFPVDIEWAFEKGKFYIVQSRPITTLSSKPSIVSKEIWKKDFSAEQSGYNLVAAFLDFGMWNFQKILFGEDQPLLIDQCFIYLQGNNIKGGYYLDKQFKRLADTLIDFIFTHPEKIEKNHKESYEINDQYVAFASNYRYLDLSKKNNKELAKIYTDLLIWQEKAHQHSLGSTWYVDSYEGALANTLLEKTQDLVRSQNSKLNPAEVFTIMTTSERASRGLLEELESLKVLEEILEDKEAKRIFFDLNNFSKLPEELSSSIKKAVLGHYEKWCWTPFGYLGPAYNLDYYLSVWSGLVKKNFDVKSGIEKLVNRPKEIKKQKGQLIKELKIPKEFVRIYDIVADIAYLKGYRKDSSYFGFFILDKILKEVSKRIGTTIDQAHMFTYQEIEKLLLDSKKADQDELARREKHAIMYKKYDDPLIIISGDEAKKFFEEKNIKIDEFIADSDIFKGNCASSGFAKGIVKIVNKSEEMGKMEEGNIMVSHTTFPSLVPAMKKAAAIITEDGGITCHAAIVARELGTPCVTGIKVATQVFKDGDMVEVDANNGVVRIIK